MHQPPFDPASITPDEVLQGPSYTIERENWREWLRFDVSPDFLPMMPVVRRFSPSVRFYRDLGPGKHTLCHRFVILPLAPIVWASDTARRIWYTLARVAKKKGWINPPEEEQWIPWNWPKYLLKRK